MAGKGKSVDWGKLTGGATMQEVAKEAAIDKPKTKAKEIRNMPVDFFNRHAVLKSEGKTTLLFTAYIIEAVREKLERDETR
ncbi:hypothetical protein D3C79_468810 [compost metagenome]